MSSEKSKDAMSMLLSFLRALTSMYQHMHWRTAGENYYGDHLLFDRLYGETNVEIDHIAEKTIGIFNDADSIGPNSEIGSAAKIMQSLVADNDKPEIFAEKALAAEKTFIELISTTKKTLESEEHLTDGVDNMLQGIADVHEGHLYLLQQRSNKKETRGDTMLARLFKLSHSLDKNGHYSEAEEIEAVMKTLAERVGLSIKDMVALADHFDQTGDYALADHFDEMAKTAKGKYKTWKGKDEKPPAGAAHKAPKAWFDKMRKEVREKNPDYSDKRIGEIVGDIWDNELSDAKREKIYKQHGKTKNPNE